MHTITFDVFFPEKLGYNYSYQLEIPCYFLSEHGKMHETLRYYCFVTSGECCFSIGISVFLYNRENRNTHLKAGCSAKAAQKFALEFSKALTGW